MWRYIAWGLSVLLPACGDGKPELNSEVQNDGLNMPPGLHTMVMGETITTLARKSAEVFDHMHPLMQELRKLIWKPVTLSNRWHLSASYLEIMKQQNFVDLKSTSQWFLKNAFGRDMQVASKDEKYFCVDYFQCSYFLAAAARLVEINPEDTQKLLTEFAADLGKGIYGRAPFLQSLLGYQTQSLLALIDFMLTTGSHEQPMGSRMMVSQEDAKRVTENFEKLTKVFYLKPFAVPLKAEDSPENNFAKLKDFVVEEMYRINGKKKEQFTAEEQKKIATLAAQLGQNVIHLLGENYSYSLYAQRLTMTNASTWIENLRQWVKADPARDADGDSPRRTRVMQMLLKFADREFALPYGNEFFYQLQNLLTQVSLTDENAKSISTTLEKQWRDKRTYLQKILTNLKITPLTEKHDAAIASATQDNPLEFGYVFQSLMYHALDLAAEVQKLELQAQHFGKIADDKKAIAKEKKSLEGFINEANDFEIKRLSLACLAVDARVTGEEAAKFAAQKFLPMFFIDKHDVPNSLSIIRADDTLGNICYYDRDAQKRAELTQTMRVTSLARRLSDFQTDRMIAKSNKHIADMTTIKGIMLFASLPLMLEAGAAAHIATQGTLRGLGSLTLGAAGKKALTNYIASLPAREGMLAVSFLRMLQTKGAAFAMEQSKQLIGCYVGAWAFSQSMQLMSAPILMATGQMPTFSQLLNNPLSIGNVMGMFVFRLLPLSNHYLVDKLGTHLLPKVSPYALGVAHDTALFSFLPYFHHMVEGSFKSEELQPYQEELAHWQIVENVSHAYLSAVAFRSQAFYAQFLGDTPAELYEQHFHNYLQKTHALR